MPHVELLQRCETFNSGVKAEFGCVLTSIKRQYTSSAAGARNCRGENPEYHSTPGPAPFHGINAIGIHQMHKIYSQYLE